MNENETRAFDGFKFQLGDLVRYKTDILSDELQFAVHKRHADTVAHCRYDHLAATMGKSRRYATSLRRLE